MTENIISRNPMTGSILKEIPRAPTSELGEVFRRSARAQADWAKVPVKVRAKKLIQLREVLVRKADSLAETIHLENGKPEFEAYSCEILPALELLTFCAILAPRALKNKSISIRNPFLAYRKSYLNFWPLGTVAVIAPWNYPFFLAFGDIVMAVVAGNSVVFKPSEYTPWVGQRIQELFDEAGFPVDLVQTVQGDGSLGAAIIDHKPAKVFFTGSVRTGKAIMAQAAQYLIPVVLELGGKDAMVILPDSDLDYATSAALWGGFTNSGQVCASTERIIVHDSIADSFIEQLKEKIARVPADNWGAITMDKQKSVYDGQIRDAKDRGMTFYCGGEFNSDRTQLNPTLVGGHGIEETQIYQEETFGPVIAIAKYHTIPEAIQKANGTKYGLLASVIGRDVSLAESVARELQAGTVLVNEVAFSAGLPETPWGGLKDSGFGRKHSEIGMMEFVNVRHINRPRFSFLNMKSIWWFPYTPYQREAFRAWFQLYRASPIDRLKAIPHLLWNLLQLLKREPRI